MGLGFLHSNSVSEQVTPCNKVPNDMLFEFDKI